MDDDTARTLDDFSIRLQFPDGNSQIVNVHHTTTVSDLYEEHVAPHIVAGLIGQLIYMGRPLTQPNSRMCDHGITENTVVQIFMRRPTHPAIQPEVLPESEQQANNMIQCFTAICGFGLACSWLYFLFGASENMEATWRTQLPVAFCLTILTVIFILAGGITRSF